MQGRRKWARGLTLLTAGAAGLFAATQVRAVIITNGDLAILRVGDGSTALGTTSAPVFIDDYSTGGGSPVGSISVPSTGASELTLTGNSTTEGVITISQDKSRLVFAGYRIDAGTASPTAATKVLATLLPNGTLDTSVGVTDVGTSATRSATTTDGSI